MGGYLTHIMVELWRFYLTWIIHVIGTVQLIVLLGIHNYCRICGFSDLFEVKRGENKDDL